MLAANVPDRGTFWSSFAAQETVRACQRRPRCGVAGMCQRRAYDEWSILHAKHVTLTGSSVGSERFCVDGDESCTNHKPLRQIGAVSLVRGFSFFAERTGELIY